MNKTIAVVTSPSGGFTVSIPEEANQQKKDALSRAASVHRVTSQEELADAIFTAVSLKGITKEVERARVEIKRPYLDATKAIDATAEQFVSEIKREIARVESLASNYQAELQRKADEARREQGRKQREAEESARKEQARLHELEEALKREDLNKRQREQLEQAKNDAEFAAAEANQDAAEAQTVVVAEAPKAAGAAIRTTVTFEVTDIEAFYQWDRERRAAVPSRDIPTFVKLEINRSLFNEYIKTLPDTMHTLPGIKIIRKIDVAARSVAPSIKLP